MKYVEFNTLSKAPLIITAIERTSVKIFRAPTHTELEKDINYFLEDTSIELVRSNYAISNNIHFVILTYKHWD